MQPQTRVTSPQGNGQPMEQMLGGGGGVQGANPLSDSLAQRLNNAGVILRQPS